MPRTFYQGIAHLIMILTGMGVPCHLSNVTFAQTAAIHLQQHPAATPERRDHLPIRLAEAVSVKLIRRHPRQRPHAERLRLAADIAGR